MSRAAAHKTKRAAEKAAYDRFFAAGRTDAAREALITDLEAADAAFAVARRNLADARASLARVGVRS